MQTIVNNISIKNANKYPKLRLRAATLYYLRIEFTNLIVYKIGYTTTSLLERVHGRPTSYRYVIRKGKRTRVRAAGHNGMGLPLGTRVYVVASLDHHNASYVYQVEQALHTKYALQRYKGEWLMENGNTELYMRDILELDN